MKQKELHLKTWKSFSLILVLSCPLYFDFLVYVFDLEVDHFFIYLLIDLFPYQFILTLILKFSLFPFYLTYSGVMVEVALRWSSDQYSDAITSFANGTYYFCIFYNCCATEVHVLCMFFTFCWSFEQVFQLFWDVFASFSFQFLMKMCCMWWFRKYHWQMKWLHQNIDLMTILMQLPPLHLSK